MKNKEIIIDGVNVSGCECFYINDSNPERKECINPCCKSLCKENSNCVYKQLKRKEQECQQLINKNNRLEEEVNSTKLLLERKNNQYAAKMQICDELHNIIKNRNEEIKNLIYVLYKERELTLDFGKSKSENCLIRT